MNSNTIDMSLRAEMDETFWANNASPGEVIRLSHKLSSTVKIKNSILGQKWEDRKTFWAKSKQVLVKDALVVRNGRQYWDGHTLRSPCGYTTLIGDSMETESEMIKVASEECKKAVEVLKQSFNEIRATEAILEPSIKEMIDRIRSSRMTVTTELKQSLSMMKEVRKFFLESEYKEEIERLEKFIVLGERLRAMIQDGTMDAITDIIIKLMGKGESSHD